MSDTARQQVDMMALRFLERGGPHCVGILDDENKMAAALLFIGLQQRGLAIAEIGENGPIYRITPAGRSTLLSSQEEG